MQASLALSTPLSRTGSGLPPPHAYTFFCEVRHDEPLPAGGPDQQGPACVAGAQQSGGGGAAAQGAAPHAGSALVGPSEGLVSKWRQKERLKTTAVALVMCLNIGGCWYARKGCGAGKLGGPSYGGGAFLAPNKQTGRLGPWWWAASCMHARRVLGPEACREARTANAFPLPAQYWRGLPAPTACLPPIMAGIPPKLRYRPNLPLADCTPCLPCPPLPPQAWTRPT